LNRTVKRPYLIEARRLTPNTRIRDAGVILDLMIHDIDIVLKLVRHPIANYSIAGHSIDANNGFEDVAAAQLEFENGCVARLLASRAAYTTERNLTVVEPDKVVNLDFSRDPHTEVSIHRRSADADSTG